VQKEGCDGIITSACFIVHRMPKAIRTVCLEFFGQVRDSVPAIVEIKRFFDARAREAEGDRAGERVMLAGLEHMDERYLKAVGYATKARHAGRPIMVLIGDIVGENEDAVARAASNVVQLANSRGGEGFIAVGAETRRTFWLDRARTAAIARHTNAFKINEDVVIPLERLGDYSDGIERINIELSIENKLSLLDALDEYLSGDLPLFHHEDKIPAPELLADRRERARELIARVGRRWRYLLENLDAAFDEKGGGGAPAAAATSVCVLPEPVKLR